MINQIHMGRMNPSSFSLVNGDSLGMSETGEFDFLNYLLGLQNDSAIADLEMDGTGLNQISDSKQLTDSDQALLEVFEKKEQTKNPLLTVQAFSGNPLSSLQQPQIEAPLPLDGKGQAEWTSIQNFQSPQSAKSKPEVGFHEMEDPLSKVAFEAALKNQTEQSESSKDISVKMNQPGVIQQRGKQIQAFNALKKDVSRDVDNFLNLEKLPTDKAGVDALPIEGVDKPKKKSTESLEFGLADSKIDTSSQLDNIQPKDSNSHRISQATVPEVFHKVESMVHHGGGKMTLMLTPPELGQVEIHVSTKGKNVEVSVKSDNDFAKMAIESQVADLQQSLQSQDLNLSKLEVHVSREMDPSFLENQYAGFSNGYREENSSRSKSENPWKMEAMERDRKSNNFSSMNVVNATRAAARWTDSRVDIRI